MGKVILEWNRDGMIQSKSCDDDGDDDGDDDKPVRERWDDSDRDERSKQVTAKIHTFMLQ